MKTTTEMIEVMVAYERGAEIEYKELPGTDWNYCTAEPAWSWNDTDYRVKEKTNDLVEQVANGLTHVKDGAGDLFAILNVFPKTVALASQGPVDYENLYANYTKPDGSKL